jgi:hypothetical protein
LGVRPSEFILSEFQSPSRRIFIGSHSLPPLWSPNRSFTPLALPEPTPPPALHPRPGALRSRARRARAHGAPPAGQLPALLHPSAATNQQLVSSYTSSTSSPAKNPARAAGFRRARPPPLVQGPNCEVWNLSRVLSVNRGHICEFLKSSRPPVQNIISNSTCLLLILVNSVENRRKNRKMQTQFGWFRCEKSYNFCYTHMV